VRPTRLLSLHFRHGLTLGSVGYWSQDAQLDKLKQKLDNWVVELTCPELKKLTSQRDDSADICHRICTTYTIQAGVYIWVYAVGE